MGISWNDDTTVEILLLIVKALIFTDMDSPVLYCFVVNWRELINSVNIIDDRIVNIARETDKQSNIRDYHNSRELYIDPEVNGDGHTKSIWTEVCVVQNSGWISRKVAFLFCETSVSITRTKISTFSERLRTSLWLPTRLNRGVSGN